MRRPQQPSINVASLAEVEARTYVSVKQAPFLARGDGKTDDTIAIRRAVAKVAADGGGVVFFPPGTYLCKQVTGSFDAFVELQSGVMLLGSGDASVLKAADGLNANGDFNFFVGENVDSVRVSSLKFDCNGQNNPVPVANPVKRNRAVYVRKGRGITVDNVTVVNNAGRQCFNFGDNAATPSVFDLLVSSVRVRNVGTAVAGNSHQTDHSVIYAQADGFHISRCLLRNDTMAAESTALEIHGRNGTVEAPFCELFGTALNIVAIVQDHVNVTYSAMEVVDCRRPIRFWCWAGFTMERIAFEGCNFVQHEDALVDLVNADVQVQAGCTMRDIGFDDCLFYSKVTDYTRSIHGITVGRVLDMRIRDCRFRSIPGRAVNTSDLVDGELDLRIEDCDMVDCGVDAGGGNERAFVGLNSPDAIGRVRVSECTMRGTVVGTAAVSAGNDVIATVSNVGQWSVGDPINGEGIPDGATVIDVDVGAATLQLSANATTNVASSTIFKHGQYGIFGNADIGQGQIEDNPIDTATIGTNGIGAQIALTGSADAVRIRKYDDDSVPNAPNSQAVGNPGEDSAWVVDGAAVVSIIARIAGTVQGVLRWTATQLTIATGGVDRLVVDADQFNAFTDNQLNNGLNGRRWVRTWTNGLAVRVSNSLAPNNDDCFLTADNATGGPTLPAANTGAGALYWLRVTGGGVTVGRTGGDTINGAGADYAAADGLHMLVSDGVSNWYAFQIS